MFRSAGMRFIIVGALALMMFIPLNLVSEIVQERSRYSDQTIADISREWGGAQLISGPLLVIPVTEEVTYKRKREAIDAVTGRSLRDDKNNLIYEHYEETVTEDRAPVYLYPERFEMDVATQTQTRARGVFEVPVFTADVGLDFNFDTEIASDVLSEKQTLIWSEAELRVLLNSNRALRGEAILETGTQGFDLEPIPASKGAGTGVFSRTSDPRKLGDFSLRLSMNGAQHFGVAAVGRTTKVTMNSDWPDPSFFGDFLPDARDVAADGFSATWTVPHLARSLPQVTRENPDGTARSQATMMVRYLTPNDFYQKAWRSARYGILFISLTFLTILLLDRGAKKPAHPVQYLMVGLAQSVFVLLMLAYAEQIGFGAAYLVAAGATIGLLTVFGATALKLGKKTGLLAGVLVTVYAVLYLILRSADFALLAGATLAFVALALTMWLTRNEEWQGPERTGGGRWFKRTSPAAPSVPAE
ncbi:MAG: cell envelope integrity protein CreD [Paracoccaceae bacterium]|uniref:cell envelope integrity protein CreD n=1 Tax=Sulfitobacter pontiacus TaxID=60137 RepID=UPI0032939EB5